MENRELIGLLDFEGNEVSVASPSMHRREGIRVSEATGLAETELLVAFESATLSIVPS